MAGARSRTGWLPLVATVAWRSERRGSQWPVAVTCGGERLAITVQDAWVEGPLEAGRPLARVFVVVDADGLRYRIRSQAGKQDRIELEVRQRPAPPVA